MTGPLDSNVRASFERNCTLILSDLPTCHIGITSLIQVLFKELFFTKKVQKNANMSLIFSLSKNVVNEKEVHTTYHIYV